MRERARESVRERVKEREREGVCLRERGCARVSVLLQSMS